MRTLFISALVLTLLLSIDWYFYQAIRHLIADQPDRIRTLVRWIYWGITLVLAIVLVGMFMSTLSGYRPRGGSLDIYLFSTIFGIYLAKVLGLAPLLLDDVRRLGIWGYQQVAASQPGEAISRSTFLSWVGLGLAGTLYGTMLWGYTNVYNYQLKRIKLALPRLPKAFDGLKVVQISDIHSGSLGDRQAVQKGIDMILAEKPDLILFTGDLVNSYADEMDPWTEVFAQLKAPMGVYSILGNHDYGDHGGSFPDDAAKVANLNRVKELQQEMGWRLLLNEHALLEREGEKIALIGVENWSARGSFGKHGRLDKAYAGTEAAPVKLLMTHDPSHWDAEVRQQYPDINLTMSGHTHGMQFGTENPFFRFSPVQWMYKQWAGLYSEGSQHLYVNRGFGFIGYQGRVGIMPEITVFELKKANE